jgi:hypothetical protein
MLTGVALMTHDITFPGDWAFVYGVLLLIVLIFVRMYVWKPRARRRTVHRSGQKTAHHASGVPHRDENHEDRGVSRRRPNGRNPTRPPKR